MVVAIVVMTVTAFAQQADRSSPPRRTPGDGGFTVQRLPGRPGIDGRAWMLADVHAGDADPFTPAGADYTLRFTDPDESGDFERWTVLLQRPGSAPVPLTADGKSAFVYVTPDARYVFLEPLRVIDVMAWRRYDLTSALGIQPYVTIRAIRPGGHSVFIERRNCAADCANRTDEEFFELVTPSGN